MKAEELFNKGLSILKEGNTLSAMACFEKAHETLKTPEVRSYLAFCISVERGQIGEAVRMCEESLVRDPDNPSHYLNLGRIYLHANRREDAVEALRAGAGKSSSSVEGTEIRLLLENLATRKRPLLPFLPRSHFLNRYPGFLLHLLRLR